MQALNMITVCDKYQPLAGTGENTIRLWEGKYQALQVGDEVVMHYTDNPNTKGPAMATEFLRVSAIAIAPLATLLDFHLGRNHGAFLGSVDLARKSLLAHYEVDGRVIPDEALFCAIYF